MPNIARCLRSQYFMLAMFARPRSFFCGGVEHAFRYYGVMICRKNQRIILMLKKTPHR